MTVTTSDRSSGRSPVAGAWPRLVLALLLLALLVAAMIVGSLAWADLRRAEQAREDRAEVLRVSELFATRANNFSSAEADAYERSVTPLLTTRYEKEWTSRFAELRKYDGTETVTSEGTVRASGVASLDVDSATVLVVADTQVVLQGQELNGALRWQVDLFKVDDRWLVDDYIRVGPGGVAQ